VCVCLCVCVCVSASYFCVIMCAEMILCVWSLFSHTYTHKKYSKNYKNHLPLKKCLLSLNASFLSQAQALYSRGADRRAARTFHWSLGRVISLSLSQALVVFKNVTFKRSRRWPANNNVCPCAVRVLFLDFKIYLYFIYL
jgi:hypothetical protein